MCSTVSPNKPHNTYTATVNPAYKHHMKSTIHGIAPLYISDIITKYEPLTTLFLQKTPRCSAVQP